MEPQFSKAVKFQYGQFFLVIYNQNEKNVILAALWYGNEKPAMGTFLEPFQGSFMK